MNWYLQINRVAGLKERNGIKKNSNNNKTNKPTKKKHKSLIGVRNQISSASVFKFGVSPGMTEIVFNARRTLKVLSADTFPRSTNSVTYLK